MSKTSSESNKCSISDNDSEFNYIPGNYSIIETEIMQASDSDNGDVDEQTSFADVEPYASEPMADEEWVKQYRQRQAGKEQRLASLKDRFAGKESLSDWCSCGKCSTNYLQNENECMCCQGMDRCVVSLSDEWVLEEHQTAPQCITLHPAFKIVCLERWSLRFAADKYRTIDKKSYKQIGSYEAFMRSVAYREFIHLVFNRVGKMRIPLPACAYHAIISKFKPKDSSERFVGYQEEEDEDDENDDNEQ